MSSKDQEFYPWLVDIRRDLHRHPEIARNEKRTTAKIVELLSELDVEVRTFPDMTGAVGLIRGSREGPTIALRADIDALPIRELNETPYKSQHEGAMHACGHDANTTIMLGVARKIVDTGLASGIQGNVKLLFQPAEERGAGAKAMIERGVLEDPRVDRVVAGHMSTELPVGTVGVFPAQGYASADRFELIIHGKGAHGARPEEGIDPIVAASSFVMSIQSILSRNIKPTEGAVVTVGKLVAGDVGNVIPESAQLEGTIRALSSRVRDSLIRRLREMAAGLETTYQVRADYRFLEGIPPCTNDSEVARFLYETSLDLLGPRNVSYLPPVMASEDFAYFALERPSAIMRLGCSNEEKGILSPLHSPRFDIDERVLEIGADIFYHAVKSYLAGGPA